MHKLVFLIATALVSTSLAGPPQPVTLKIGAAAPDFTLPGNDGKSWSLDDFSEARILVIVFTCNHCPDARAASGRIREIAVSYRDRGVALVAISSNDPRALRLDEIGYSVWGDTLEEMKHHADECAWTFPYLFDGGTQAAALAYGAQATPHVFVFDRERKLRYTGRIDDARRDPKLDVKGQLHDALDALLDGRQPATPVTRPVGCSTKWSWKRESVLNDNEKWKAKPVSVAALDAAAAKLLRGNPTDKLRLVNLWSLSCGPCVSEFPALVETYRRFQNRPFEFVSISLDSADDHAKVLKFLENQQAAIADRTRPSLEKEGRTTNNYRFDGDPDALAEALDPEWSGALPHSVLIAPGGKIIWRHPGEIDAIGLRRAIVRWMDENH